MCTACRMSVEGRPLSYARGPVDLCALHHALVTVYVGEAGALEHVLDHHLHILVSTPVKAHSSRLKAIT